MCCLTQWKCIYYPNRIFIKVQWRLPSYPKNSTHVLTWIICNWNLLLNNKSLLSLKNINKPLSMLTLTHLENLKNRFVFLSFFLILPVYTYLYFVYTVYVYLTLDPSLYTVEYTVFLPNSDFMHFRFLDFVMIVFEWIFHTKFQKWG